MKSLWRAGQILANHASFSVKTPIEKIGANGVYKPGRALVKGGIPFGFIDAHRKEMVEPKNGKAGRFGKAQAAQLRSMTKEGKS